jgi:hypothetical protein
MVVSRRARHLPCLAALGLAGCPTTTTTTTPPGVLAFVLPTRPLCESAWAGVPEVRGQLGDARLIEVSGVVPSPTTPDLLWVHNDSGDDAAIYGIGADGRFRGRVALPFAVVDLEDIAVGSCPDRTGPCLHLADTGNNAGDRADTAVYIVREPVPDDDGVFAADASAVLVARIDASPAAGLPGGLDVEALVVFPDASALLLFEKVDGPSARVFARRAPFDGDDAGAFAVVGSVSTESPSIQFGRMITGADLHPSGKALLVRTYTGIFEHRVDDAAALLDLGDVRLTTVTFGPFSEAQGEAIAFDAAGHIVTISEARDRAASEVPVNVLVCGG